jgi:transposase InsO family protein
LQKTQGWGTLRCFLFLERQTTQRVGHPPAPRKPKAGLNGPPFEEFYQVTACSLEMKKLNRELRQWEKIYNTVRPHQDLGYLTPQQFLLSLSSQRKD